MSVRVGDKVRVRSTEMEGVISELNGEEAVLVWRTVQSDGSAQSGFWRGKTDELIPVMSDDFFGNCSNCVDY